MRQGRIPLSAREANHIKIKTQPHSMINPKATYFIFKIQAKRPDRNLNYSALRQFPYYLLALNLLHPLQNCSSQRRREQDIGFFKVFISLFKPKKSPKHFERRVPSGKQRVQPKQCAGHNIRKKTFTIGANEFLRMLLDSISAFNKWDHYHLHHPVKCLNRQTTTII